MKIVKIVFYCIVLLWLYSLETRTGLNKFQDKKLEVKILQRYVEVKTDIRYFVNDKRQIKES